MEAQLNPTIQQSYETLPDLLKDLHIFINIAQRLSRDLDNINSNWNAQIDCAGDFHNLHFYYSDSGEFGYFDDTKPIDQTYESTDALMTEFNYIQEYFLQHQEEIGKIQFQYYITCNGGKPVLRFYCRQRYEREETSPDGNQIYLQRLLEQTAINSLATMGITILSAVPVMVLAKYILQ